MQKFILAGVFGVSAVFLLRSPSFAADLMTCTGKNGKAVALKAKDNEGKEKECKSLRGVWAEAAAKSAKTESEPAKNEEEGKSGGW